MPVMNGISCNKYIRTSDDPKILSIPIIAVSANIDYKYAVLEVVINLFLEKPVN